MIQRLLFWLLRDLIDQRIQLHVRLEHQAQQAR